MFPYPSAQGLHVGHPEGYTATDIVSRYQRMHGMEVLHPMGWDAFGLPAENYAIKTGVHPDVSTHENIKTFKRQIQSLGLSYDWEREIDTSSPEYYKWTQWMFLQMYEHGLAYRKKARVNWCNGCQTVLANEQVVDGKCERSQDPVIQKDLAQWFFKTTNYAEQLLNDLETIDWPEPIKLMQKNWIGKSEGAEIEFRIKNEELGIKVYTTRPDTLYGVTYVVLAPEHSLVNTLTTSDNKKLVEDYLKITGTKNDLERTSLNKEKTGVFTGSYVVHPLTGKEIPIWIADYVLATYGTGAVMAVPAHDERDKEFAAIYHLPVIDLPVNEADKWALTEQAGGTRKTNYKLRDWLISRQRYWGAPIPIVYDPEGKPHPVKIEHLPLVLPTDVDYLPKGTSPIGTSASYKALAEKLYGTGWHFEVDTMDTFVCSSWYYLRYCDPHNDKQFAAPETLAHWLPVDLYVGGAEHAVLHLLYARFFHKALQDFGFIPTSVGREPFQALRNQGMILGEDNQKMSKSRGNVINPDDIVNQYGADTLRLYEMFMGPFADGKPWNTKSIEGMSRFLNRVKKVIQDNKALPTNNESSNLIHFTVKKVSEDIVHFHFNTAISTMMTFLNAKDFLGENNWDKSAIEKFILLLHPFAPFTTQDLWKELGHDTELDHEVWPSFDANKIISDTVNLAIQVNGKLRDTIIVATNSSEVDVKQLAQNTDKIKKYLAGKQIVKLIYVPNKLVSIVVK